MRSLAAPAAMPLQLFNYTHLGKGDTAGNEANSDSMLARTSRRTARDWIVKERSPNKKTDGPLRSLARRAIGPDIFASKN
jgi:hypothetical protein